MAVLMVSAAATAAVASPRERWPSTHYAPVLSRADSLWSAGGARVLTYLDSLTLAARARGERDLEMAAAIRRASTRGFVKGDYDSAVAESKRWIPAVRASRDTLTWCIALRTIAYADLARERFAPSLVTYRRMLDLAVRARLDVPEGYARIGCSYIAIQQGRLAEAERGYRIAIRRLEGRDAFGTRVARSGLGNALSHLGRPDEARREYERVVADARAVAEVWNEADALNDLGYIEFHFGDPSRAADLFWASARLQRSVGRRLLALRATHNAAECLGVVGRSDEQAALIDSVVRGAIALGAHDLLAAGLADLAGIRRRQGRFAEAEALLRRAAPLKDSVSVGVWVSLVLERAEMEIRAGRPAAAAEIASGTLADFGPRAELRDRVRLLSLLGHARMTSGEPGLAIGPLREAVSLVARSGGLLGAFSIDCETQLARAFGMQGRADSALARYRHAAGAWDRLRATPGDPAWREAFDGQSRDLYGPLASALLDPARGGTPRSRAEEAYAALQRFRSRTLEDVLRGAEGRAELPRVPLARLQRALRPGEVLLDIFATPDTTFLFAVTRNGIQVATTAGSHRLAPRLRRLRDLVSSGPTDAATIAAAAKALGTDLLGPLAETLRGSNTVLVSAGSLAEFPLGLIRVPGESEPIAANHDFALVPSATLLTEVRVAGEAAPVGSGVAVLNRSTDVSGGRLEGVERESRWLERRFPNTRVRSNDGTRPLDAMLEGLGPAAVLHIASHTRTSAAAPWRAGFLLGRGAGEDAYLTAARITRLHAVAPVCVLASCTSAGTTTGSEGLPNLAAAWLAAGAKTVVATLWEVDDRATARFVEDLYGALGRGATTGAALREAQRVARSSPDRSEPRLWGGFVILGDPSTSVALGKAP